MCGVAISYYDEETQKRFLERLKTDHWQLTVAAMQRIKQACPPPHIAVSALEKVWNASVAHAMQKKLGKTISFERKKFAPYLDKLSSDQELETLFLKFFK